MPWYRSFNLLAPRPRCHLVHGQDVVPADERAGVLGIHASHAVEEYPVVDGVSAPTANNVVRKVGEAGVPPGSALDPEADGVDEDLEDGLHGPLETSLDVLLEGLGRGLDDWDNPAEDFIVGEDENGPQTAGDDPRVARVDGDDAPHGVVDPEEDDDEVDGGADEEGDCRASLLEGSNGHPGVVG